MSDSRSAPTLLDGLELLERAVGYTLGSLQLVTPDALSRPTPCEGWDLGALLSHMNDSLLALQEAVDVGGIDLAPASEDPGACDDPVTALRNRACQMLGAWTAGEVAHAAYIGGFPVSVSDVTGAGAVEVAVHGWDVAQACGGGRPLPPRLAEDLLTCAQRYVTPADRPVRFADPLGLSQHAAADERLLAFLGRRH
jgi:uncharacterized protein (TIGR03086 family)